MTMPDPIPAATLVVFRERIEGPPELLVVERAGQMAFAAGALVFPGGRIDPSDYVIGADRQLSVTSIDLDNDESAARVAAIRETIEETGLPIGFVRPPSADATARLRAALHQGADFAEMLRSEGWQLDLDLLTLFARWCPNFREIRNFDTRFYIARLPVDAPDPSVDETENALLFWASAADALAMADRGEARVIFPTRRNLERLALFDSFEAARLHARSVPVRLIQPWVEERGGQPSLCIPEDLGYPITHQLLTEVRRG